MCRFAEVASNPRHHLMVGCIFLEERINLTIIMLEYRVIIHDQVNTGWVNSTRFLCPFCLLPYIIAIFNIQTPTNPPIPAAMAYVLPRCLILHLRQ